jgi:hypothetical protein
LRMLARGLVVMARGIAPLSAEVQRGTEPMTC